MYQVKHVNRNMIVHVEKGIAAAVDATPALFSNCLQAMAEHKPRPTGQFLASSTLAFAQGLVAAYQP